MPPTFLPKPHHMKRLSEAPTGAALASCSKEARTSGDWNKQVWHTRRRRRRGGCRWQVRNLASRAHIGVEVGLRSPATGTDDRRMRSAPTARLVLAAIVSIGSLGCGLASFDVSQNIPEQTVPGSPLGALLPASLFAIPMNIDIQSETAARGTGPASSATLKSVSLDNHVALGGDVRLRRLHRHPRLVDREHEPAGGRDCAARARSGHRDYCDSADRGRRPAALRARRARRSPRRRRGTCPRPTRPTSARWWSPSTSESWPAGRSLRPAGAAPRATGCRPSRRRRRVPGSGRRPRPARPRRACSSDIFFRAFAGPSKALSSAITTPATAPPATRPVANRLPGPSSASACVCEPLPLRARPLGERAHHPADEDRGGGRQRQVGADRERQRPHAAQLDGHGQRARRPSRTASRGCGPAAP